MIEVNCKTKKCINWDKESQNCKLNEITIFDGKCKNRMYMRNYSNVNL